VRQAVHQPVMVETVVRFLLEGGGSRFIDCTVGAGGHCEALMRSAGKALKIYGIDRDPEAIGLARSRLSSRKRVVLTRGNYADLEEIADGWGVSRVDGILTDFGQSSDQLDDPKRGFSHRFDGPLDMRYDTTTGLAAAELINQSSREEIVLILRRYGEVFREAKRIAEAIVRARPLDRTGQLADIVREVCHEPFIQKALARVFMAFRIAVNDELHAIDQLLPQIHRLLVPGGRMVFISYDSHQDRRVKSCLTRLTGACTCPPGLPVCVCGARRELEILTRRVVRPTQSEVQTNPRCRSARLRAAVKLGQ